MKKLRFQWSTFSAENIIIKLRYVFDLIKYKLWSKWGQVWVRYHFLPLCLTCNKIFVNQMRHLPVILYLYQSCIPVPVMSVRQDTLPGTWFPAHFLSTPARGWGVLDPPWYHHCRCWVPGEPGSTSRALSQCTLCVYRPCTAHHEPARPGQTWCW